MFKPLIVKLVLKDTETVYYFFNKRVFNLEEKLNYGYFIIKKVHLLK